jgi:hypothetical protein
MVRPLVTCIVSGDVVSHEDAAPGEHGDEPARPCLQSEAGDEGAGDRAADAGDADMREVMSCARNRGICSISDGFCGRTTRYRADRENGVAACERPDRNPYALSTQNAR